MLYFVYLHPQKWSNHYCDIVSFQKQRFGGSVMRYKISSLIAFSVVQGLLEKPEISNKSSTDLSSFAGHPRLYCLLISLSRDSVAFA